VLADRMIESEIGFSPLQADRALLVTASDIQRVAKSEKLHPPLVLPGAGRARGYGGFAKMAAALSHRARELELEEGDAAVAILFHDSDGTQSSPRDHWEKVVAAVQSGFDAMGFGCGVAMIPKPKQEAWLLCAIRQPPYSHCEHLESESGNDASPKALKAQLRAAHGDDVNTAVMVGWIEDGRVDPAMIDMPSFNRFRSDLRLALARL
jgi:hypothetical protein